MKYDQVPKEAIQAFNLIKELLENQLVGLYLYGSSVMGGLREKSDVDILALTNSSLSERTRFEFAERIMKISGRPGNSNDYRPLEVTVVNLKEVVPWQYPPKLEFMYGEWLRGQFERGDIPGATVDPDLALLLAQLQRNSASLFGPKAAEVLEPIPWADIRRAMRESLPGLAASLKGDERNVVLTLARMWFTASTDEFCSKDQAAEWAISRLPEDLAPMLDQARKAYLGEYVDHWDQQKKTLTTLVDLMKSDLELLLSK